jgi:hypothetical protein
LVSNKYDNSIISYKVKKIYFAAFVCILLIVFLFNYVVLGRAINEERSITVQLKEQIDPITNPFNKLTDQDRKKYLLAIDKRKISKLRDTVLYKLKGKYLNVPVLLYNLSNDTLRYLTMTCSWDDFFSFDNKKLLILGWPCDSNFPISKTLLPHKSIVYNIPIILTGNYLRREKFRISMGLFIVNKKSMNFINDLPISDRKTKNLIWSNEVSIN